MKDIGSLSFGQWTPSPQSQARSAAADTLVFTVPDQLGVDCSAHVIESVLARVAPALGWR